MSDPRSEFFAALGGLNSCQPQEGPPIELGQVFTAVIVEEISRPKTAKELVQLAQDALEEAKERILAEIGDGVVNADDKFTVDADDVDLRINDEGQLELGVHNSDGLWSTDLLLKEHGVALFMLGVEAVVVYKSPETAEVRVPTPAEVTNEILSRIQAAR